MLLVRKPSVLGNKRDKRLVAKPSLCRYLSSNNMIIKCAKIAIEPDLNPITEKIPYKNNGKTNIGSHTKGAL